MAFTKDIFISYAHIDNESLLQGDKGWISEFQRSLEIRLGQVYGSKPMVWRDHKLTGNDMFDTEIIDQLPQVKLMISIISPRYLKSEWCLKELSKFHEACEQNIGFSINNKARLLKVVKTPVRMDNYPDLIRDQLGYEFYMIDADTGRSHEFSQVFGEKAQRYFWAKLDDLTHDVAYMLEEFDKLEKDPSYATQVNPHIDTSKTIYLAESSNDMRIYRDELKRELISLGFKVLPNHSLSLEGDTFRQQVTEMMNESDLGIQMLGSKYGIIPEGEENSLIAIQQEIASKISQEKELKRIIWIPENENDRDERQEELINRINNSEEELSRAEVLTSNMQDFKSAVQDIFKKSIIKPDPEIKETHVSTAEEGEGAEVPAEELPKSVYLICTENDLDDLVELEDFMFSKGYEVVLPVFEGEEDLIRQDYLENLRNCDAAMIYFGQGNDLWVRSKVRDLIKVVGYGRKKPLKHKFVYIAPPVSRSKERFRSHGMKAINETDGEGFKEEVMSDFINQLEQ